MSVRNYQCLSPCFRGPSGYDGGDYWDRLLRSCYDYVREFFTSPISQFDLLDLMFLAALLGLAFKVITNGR